MAVEVEPWEPLLYWQKMNSKPLLGFIHKRGFCIHRNTGNFGRHVGSYQCGRLSKESEHTLVVCYALSPFFRKMLFAYVLLLWAFSIFGLFQSTHGRRGDPNALILSAAFFLAGCLLPLILNWGWQGWAPLEERFLLRILASRIGASVGGEG